MCHAVDSVVPTEGTGRYGSAIITVMLDPWTMPLPRPLHGDRSSLKCPIVVTVTHTTRRLRNYVTHSNWRFFIFIYYFTVFQK